LKWQFEEKEVMNVAIELKSFHDIVGGVKGEKEES